MAVRNYAPELLALFKQAATRTIRIELSSHSQAVSYRHRLHNLRKAMRQEQHPLLPIAEGVMFSIEEVMEGGSLTGNNPEMKTFLIARPADTGLVEALKKSGVEVGEPEDYAQGQVQGYPQDTSRPAPRPSSGQDAMSALAMFKHDENDEDKNDDK